MKKLFFTSAFLALLLGIWAVNPNVAYANSSYATLSTINSFSSEALAANSTVSGSCGINGSNVSWSLNTETGVLTISGSGEMANYQSENEQPWYSYSSSIKSVVVRSGVTSIGDYAFRVCKNLTSISMPLNLTSIGKCAIAWCNLTPSLIIPYGVKTIGKDAFSGNENLTSVTIPSTVTQIDNYAFYKCSNITSVDISNVETWCNVVMGNEFSNPLAWAVSMNYKSLYVNGVLMENLVIPDGISSIRELAFYCCSSLKTVTIPKSVTSIGNSAFHYCNNLKAIKYCGTEEEWQNVTLGSWTGISASILYYSDYCGPNAHWSFDNGTLKVIGFGEMTSSPWQFFTDINNILTVDIEDGITSILGRAFSDCGSLTTVNIPNSVTTIGDYAFIGSGLQSVTFEGNPKVYKAAFNIASLKNVYSYGTDPQMGYDDRDEDDEYYIFKYSGKLHVLKGLKAKYSNTLPWRRFSSIVDDLVLPATNISIDKTSLVLQQNESQVLSFAITPEDATVKTVTWSSSDTSVATVDETGLVTAIAPGSAIITVSTTDGSDLSATCEVTVEETSVPVSNITLNITSSLLTIDETTSLTATITPDDATNKSVTWSSNNTEVATVDENGVVTAVAAGTATITVTAADGSGVSASCEVTVKAEEPDVPSDIEPSTDISAFTDALYFNDVENRAGDFNLELNLKCAEENITAFQCDVYLPEGVEWKYTVDKRGKIIYDLPAFNEDRTDASYHTIAPIEQKGDGSYSIIVYSGEEENILDLDGAIMTLPLTVSEEMEAGDYNIIMKNIVIVPTEGSKISIDRMVSRLTIPSYMIGDANGDDAIDVADIVATIAYMRNHPSENFIFAAADVNEDNAIDVADIVGIIRIMRSEPSASASKHNSARLASAVDAEAGSNLRITPFAVEQGTKEKTVTLDMNNPGEEFTAFQCDVYFPEGIEWKTTVDRRGNKKVVAPTFNVEADRTNALYHTIDAGYNADGSMSVIVYSSDMEIILDEKGAILDLPFVFDENLAAGVYDIKLKNVKLSRVDATKAEPADYTFSVVVGSPSGDIALKGDYSGTNEALKLLVDGSSANVTCENLLLDDEDGYTVSNTFTAENVSYSRPMANEWGTVCLPFEIESNDNIQLYALSAVDSESSTGVLTFTPIESAEAGQAVVFKKKDDKGIDVTTENAQLIAGDAEAIETKITNWAIKGSYTQTTIQSNVDASGNTDRVKRYYIAQDKFWNAKLSATVPAFRAWFENSEDVASAAKSSYTIVVEDGETTSVLNVNAEGELEECTEIYDLSGKKLTAPVKGQVNIINGKKIFVK